MADTDPKALEVYLNVLRGMTESERLMRVLELNAFLEALQTAGIRAKYPEAGEREVFLRVAARRLGRELMIKAYGWDPDLHP